MAKKSALLEVDQGGLELGGRDDHQVLAVAGVEQGEVRLLALVAPTRSSSSILPGTPGIE